MHRLEFQSSQISETSFRVYIKSGRLAPSSFAIDVDFGRAELNASLKAELLAAQHVLTKTNKINAMKFGGAHHELFFSDSSLVRGLQCETSPLLDCIPFAHWLSTRYIGAEVKQREDDLEGIWSGETIDTIEGKACREFFDSPIGKIEMGHHAVIRLAERMALKGGVAQGINKLQRVLSHGKIYEIDLSPEFQSKSVLMHGYVPKVLAYNCPSEKKVLYMLLDDRFEIPKLVTVYYQEPNNEMFQVRRALSGSK